MLTVIQDGDAIFSGAIALGSPEEREAYIAQACGHDAMLRHQVQERVAAHFQAKQAAEKPVVAVANGTVPAKANPEHPTPPLRLTRRRRKRTRKRPDKGSLRVP
jgi:hypothetical protein